MKIMPFRVARTYRDLSYLFLLALLVATAIAPVFASPQASGTVTLSLTNTSGGSGSPQNGLRAWAEGTVIISGNYVTYSSRPYTVTTTQYVVISGHIVGTNATTSGNGESTTVENGTTYYTEPAPVYLSGTATEFYMGDVNGQSEMLNATAPISFSNPYRTGQSASFVVYFSRSSPQYFIINVEAESADGGLLATASTSTSPSTAVNLFTAIVALPLFNDPMLGAYAPNSTATQPTLPLGGVFNLLLVVSLIALVASILFIFFMPQKGERPTPGSALAKVAIGVIVILLFPFIYDHIAELLNLLNQAIVAYPNPAPSYTVALSHVYTSIIQPASGDLINDLTTTVLAIAYFIVAMVVTIMMYLVGTVRIFLIGGMIVMFPLSVALRDIPFTQKLGRIIEDTLFGLILATVLSSVMLGVAGTLLANWNAGGNIFVQAGIPSQWMAAAAVIVSILAPTVMAPLTATVYQTTSQIAMSAGSVASAVYMGFGTGALGTAGSLIGIGGGTGGAGGGAAAATAGQAAAGHMSRRAILGHSLYHGFLGSAEAGLPAVGGAIGMSHGPAYAAREVGTYNRRRRDTLTGRR
ncbi:MAG: hypothetical protein JRN37_05005 [Nitrososphaerota archaeon]|jgi:hypothetical protein|nr:hypothetical protein [Nitrososphaerota archaeon]